MCHKAFCFFFALCTWTAWAQLDQITVEGGEIAAGESATFNVYLRDASGTTVDWVFSDAGSLVVTFDVTPGIIDTVNFTPVGISAGASIFIDQTTFENDRVRWALLMLTTPLTTQDAALPGDLIGTVTITTLPGTGGQTLSLTPVPGANESFIEDSVGSQALGGGELTVVTSDFQISGTAPVIDNFQVDPTSIVTGGTANLSWSVTGADNITIDQGVGAVAATGSLEVSPGATTTYTLTAENSIGAVQDSVTLTITGPPPVINDFSVNPTSIQRGQNAALSWDVTGANTVTIDQGVGSVPANGSTQVSPNGTITYTITAENSQGMVQDSLTLTVTEPPPNIGTFNLSPTQIQRGQSSTLSWSVGNADTVTIDQGIGSVDANGSVQVSPDDTTTYTITAQNAIGTVQDSITLIVDQPPAPVVDSFTVSPSLIDPGQTAELSWSVSNAATVSIDQGIGAVDATGSLTVMPNVSTAYTLTADNGSGQNVTEVAVLTVTQTELAILEFSARPLFVVFGFDTTLTWSVQGAESVSLSAETFEGVTDLGPLAASGQMDLFPEVNTTYTLSATAGETTISESVMVEVLADDALIFETEELIYGPGVLSLDLDLRNAINRPLGWTLVQKPQWLIASAESGTVDGLPSTLTFTLNPDHLPSGWTEDVLVFEALDIPFEVPVQAGESLLIFPLVRADDQFQTDILAVNLENVAIDIALELFNPNGTPAASLVNATLEPRETFTYRVPDSLGEGRGWVRMAVPGYREAQIRGFADTQTLDGEERYAYPGTIPVRGSIYVPHIAADTNFYTLGSLVNVSDFTDSFGFTAGEEDFAIDTLPPARQDLFEFRDELMDGEVRGSGWGELTSANADTLMTAVEVFGRSVQTNLRQSVGVSLDAESGSRLIFPHLAANTTVFWTGVVIINPHPNTASVNYRVYDAEGQVVAVPNPPTQLASGAKQIFLVDRNRQDLGAGAAWLEVESDLPILGYMLFGSYAPDDFFSGFQSLKRGSQMLCFPYIEPLGSDQFTGIALVNLGSAETTVDLELVDRAGNTRAQISRDLGPKQKLVELARDLFTETFEIGDKILVHGSTDLAGFELFGAGRRTLGGILAMDFQDQPNQAK